MAENAIAPAATPILGAPLSWGDDLYLTLKDQYEGTSVVSLMCTDGAGYSMIPNRNTGGASQKWVAMYGRGGGFGDGIGAAYANITAAGHAPAKIARFNLFPAKISGLFQITKDDFLAMKGEGEGYQSAAGQWMYAMLTGARQAMSRLFYMEGMGDIGQLKAAVAAGATTLTISSAAAAALDVDSVIFLSTTLPPTGTPAYLTVTKIEPVQTNPAQSTVTFTGTVAAAAVGTYVLLRQNGQNPGGLNFPLGTGAYIPTVNGQRTGADWTAKIQRPFLDVDRSVSVRKLAGNHIYAATIPTGETGFASLIQRMQNMVYFSGSNAEYILMGLDRYIELNNRTGNTFTVFQPAETGASIKQAVSAGRKDMSFSTSSSFLGKVKRDAYCDEECMWFLNNNVSPEFGYNIVFYTYGSAKERIDSGMVKNGEPGRVPTTSESGSEAEKAYHMSAIDAIDVTPDPIGNSTYSKASNVSFECPCNLAIKAPGNHGLLYIAAAPTVSADQSDQYRHQIKWVNEYRARLRGEVEFYAKEGKKMPESLAHDIVAFDIYSKA